MEVRVDVNENDSVRVHVGDTAIIDVDAYSSQDKEFRGVVTLIANTAKEKTSTDAITEFEVRILILPTSYQDLVDLGNRFPFRPGMTASVDIMTQTKRNALSVPLASVTTRNPDAMKNGQNNNANNNNDRQPQVTNTNQPKPAQQEDKIVIFINENGVAKMVEVQTGISDYDNIEILTGVSDSTEVVIGPFLAVSKRLNDGEKIRPMENNPSESRTN
jgi:HlyD family secretion protein